MIDAILKDTNLTEKLNEVTQKRIETISQSKNPLHNNFKATFVKDEDIGDVPIPLIYKHVYDPETINQDLQKNQTFIRSMLENRNDYNLRFERDNSEVSKFYSDPEIAKQFFGKGNVSSEKLKKLVEESYENQLYTDYHYYFTHPLKKVFMGPEKVDVHEHYKIHMVSPTCLIVDIFSYCSGFMLMDTFYSVIQWRFDADLWADETTKQIRYKTRVSVSYSIEFVKINMFKGRVESEGLKDNEAMVKDYWIPKVKSLLDSQSKLYYGITPTVESGTLVKEEPVQTKQPAEPIKHIQSSSNNQLLQQIGNKYGIILTVIFIILLLAKFNFTNCLAVTGCVGFGMVVHKLDEINERLKRLEDKSCNKV
jgi:hypothetical protein